MGFFKRMKVRGMRKKANRLYLHRQENQVSDLERGKEIELHHHLFKLYTQLTTDKKVPFAKLLAMESLRVAAELGDAKAQHLLSEKLFEEARFWDSLKGGLYAHTLHEKRARALFEEAFAYLKQADEVDYPLARRLHGLAYIHGWGVEKNEEKGFGLIVESIDLENAWDSATAIFTELGLNKSDFFTTVMSLKQKKIGGG